MSPTQVGSELKTVDGVSQLIKIQERKRLKRFKQEENDLTGEQDF